MFIQNESNLGNNVIYFDPYFQNRKDEIYRDSEIFKNMTNGAFILSMGIDSLKEICEDLKKLGTPCKFDLILASHNDPKDAEKVLIFLKNKNFEKDDAFLLIILIYTKAFQININ